MPDVPATFETSAVVARETKIGTRATVGLVVGAFLATVFVFAVPPTPFDALDFRSILLPYLTFYRESLHGGEFPFWNPYASLGRPFAADPQALAFWPGTISYLIFGTFWGTILLAWLHASAAAWSTARVCLRLGADRGPALVAGLVFVLSGKITGHYQAGHVQFVFSYLLLPLLLDAALRVQDSGDRRSVAWLAAVSLWQLLAGAPQVYWNCALAVALLLAGRRLGSGWQAMLRNGWRDGWRVAAAYGLGLSTAAIAMVPLAELVQQSNRGAARPEFTAVGSMGWKHWMSVLTPSVAQGYTVDWELLLYTGVAVTLLGLAGLTRVRDGSVRALWFVVMGIGLIAAGEHTPFFSVLFNWLPGYASFRVHGRSGAVLVFALIVSAALFVSPRETSRRRLVRLSVTAVGLFLLLGFLSIRNHADITAPIVYLSASMAAATVLLSSSSQPTMRAVGGVALAVILIIDLVVNDLGLKRTFITSQNYALEEPLVAALRDSGQLVKGAPPARVFAPPQAVRANAGMIYGFGTFAGSEALALNRVWSYVHWAVGLEPPAMSDVYAFDAFVAKGPFPIPWVAQSATLDLQARKIEVRPAPPRAWLVGRTRIVADWREAAGRLAAGYDANTSALLEQPLPADLPVDGDLALTRKAGSVRWLQFSRNRLLLETNTPSSALLILAEAWYPGWSASVNGIATPVIPVNGWMRGAVVPAGVSRIELRYRPTHFALGAVVSLVSLGLLAWLAGPRKTSVVGGLSRTR